MFEILQHNMFNESLFLTFFIDSLFTCRLLYHFCTHKYFPVVKCWFFYQQPSSIPFYCSPKQQLVHVYIRAFLRKVLFPYPHYNSNKNINRMRFKIRDLNWSAKITLSHSVGWSFWCICINHHFVLHKKRWTFNKKSRVYFKIMLQRTP